MTARYVALDPVAAGLCGGGLRIGSGAAMRRLSAGMLRRGWMLHACVSIYFAVFGSSGAG